MRLLVVDDSSTMRRIIVNTLQKIGFSDTVEAGNGREALERMAASSVSLVLTDWNMPEVNGLEFVRAVRANAAWAGVPILMVTTNVAKEDIVEAIRSGVNNYVAKPFTPETLREKIEAVLPKDSAA